MIKTAGCVQARPFHCSRGLNTTYLGQHAHTLGVQLVQCCSMSGRLRRTSDIQGTPHPASPPALPSCAPLPCTCTLALQPRSYCIGWQDSCYTGKACDGCGLSLQWDALPCRAKIRAQEALRGVCMAQGLTEVPTGRLGDTTCTGAVLRPHQQLLSPALGGPVRCMPACTATCCD